MEKSKSQRVVGSLLKTSDKPNPYDFVNFFPWVCKQYEVCVVVHHEIQAQMNLPRKLKQVKKKQSGKSVATKDKSSSSSSFNHFEEMLDIDNIEVTAVFDQSHCLTSIKIHNNVEVPRKLFLVIDFIFDWYPSLTTISANRGLDAYCIYEIAKILPKSNISEVFLDETCLKDQNYHILLETACNLNCLSLSKCQINDEQIEKIADNLNFMRPASKTLTFLNLSSNLITDIGAAYLANALKTNRQIAYLNLADNIITDTGASDIFNTMLEFPVLSENLMQSKLRRKEYMDEKNKLFHEFVADLRSVEEKKNMKKKVNEKSPRIKIKKVDDWLGEKVASLKVLAEGKVTTNLDVKLFDKAENLALQAIGPFEDPFENALVRDGMMYCLGNNTLSCLNFAYNNLSYTSLVKLVKVLNHQKIKQQTPRGLFRVLLEGNYLPLSCAEYAEINGLLDSAADALCSKHTKTKKMRK